MNKNTTPGFPSHEQPGFEFSGVMLRVTLTPPSTSRVLLLPRSPHRDTSDTALNMTRASAPPLPLVSARGRWRPRLRGATLPASPSCNASLTSSIFLPLAKHSRRGDPEGGGLPQGVLSWWNPSMMSSLSNGEAPETKYHRHSFNRVNFHTFCEKFHVRGGDRARTPLRGFRVGFFLALLCDLSGRSLRPELAPL